MIEPAVREIATAFVADTERLVSPFAELALDGTWPSIGTLELILSPFKAHAPKDQDEKALLTGAVAYLGCIAHDAWSVFSPDGEISLKAEGDEIVLAATNCKSLEGGETFSVALVNAVQQLLQPTNNAVPIFERFSRQFLPGHDKFTAFATGLCTGLCPWGKGPWAQKKVYQLIEQLIKTQHHLSQSCALYYQRVFAHETLGQAPELYCSNLILPPLGFDEPDLGCRGVTGLIQYLQERAVSLDGMRELSLHLSLFPDQGISALGFVLAVALEDGAPSDTLFEIAEAKRLLAPLLRTSLITARSLLNKPADTFALDDRRMALELLEREVTLGFLPLLTMPRKYYLDPSFGELFRAAAAHNLLEIERQCLELIKTLPDNADLYVQLAWCAASRATFDRAADLANEALTKTDLSPSARARALQISSSYALATDRFSDGAKLLRAASEQPSRDKLLNAQILNSLAWCLLLQGEDAEVLGVTSAALKLVPGLLDARLNRIAALLATSNEEEANRELRLLARFASSESRVFEYLRAGLGRS